jgi:hypothetical protein
MGARQVGYAVGWVVSAAKRFFLFPVPHYTRWGLYPQAAIIVACYSWWALCPVIPGASITVLGFMAVFMTVRADKFSHAERVVWVVLGFAVMVAELRSLYVERDRHDTEQRVEMARQQREFEATLHGFESLDRNSRNQYETTIHRVDGVLKTTQKVSDLTERSLESITGGDSNAYFDLMYVNDYVPVIWVQNSGKYPLRNLSIQIMDVNKLNILSESHTPQIPTMQDFDNSTQNVNIGDLGVHQTIRIPVNPAAHGDDLARYQISYSALNGGGLESVVVRVGKDGKKYKAVKTGGTNQPTEKETVDPNFPLNANGKIW